MCASHHRSLIGSKRLFLLVYVPTCSSHKLDPIKRTQLKAFAQNPHRSLAFSQLYIPKIPSSIFSGGSIDLCWNATSCSLIHHGQDWQDDVALLQCTLVLKHGHAQLTPFLASSISYATASAWIVLTTASETAQAPELGRARVDV